MTSFLFWLDDFIRQLEDCEKPNTKDKDEYQKGWYDGLYDSQEEIARKLRFALSEEMNFGQDAGYKDALSFIADVGFDYDNMDSVAGLKDLVDEMVFVAKSALEEKIDPEEELLEK